MNILRMIHHAIQIAEGYIKWLYDVLTGNGSALSVERLKICSNCEHNFHGICNQCGCVIKAKVRVKYPLDENSKSIDGCPEKKW